MTFIYLLFFLFAFVYAHDHDTESQPCRCPSEAKFDLNLTWEKRAPDGFDRQMILVNSKFPAPTLRLVEGDDVEITVRNHLPFNATVHFHGIEQQGTAWSDGVPGVSQRPIQPGKTFTYKWKATQYGSYFYHAHSKGQIEDGLYGAIVISPKCEQNRPFQAISSNPSDIEQMENAERHVKPLIVSDWRHTTSTETWDLSLKSGVEIPCIDSVLVNGKGAVTCWSREDIQKYTGPAVAPLLNGMNMTDKGCLPAQALAALAGNAPTNISQLPPTAFDTCTSTQGSHEVIEVSSGEWVAFDLISAAGLATFVVSFDEHPMWVYAMEGLYVKPTLVEALTLANGDRVSVLIKLDKTPGNYSMRAVSNSAAQMIFGTATMSYKNSKNTRQSTPYIDPVGTNTTSDVVFLDANTLKNLEAPAIAPKADATYVFSLGLAGATYLWTLNGTRFDVALEEIDEPLLFQPRALTNVSISTKSNSWIDLVFTVAMPGNPPHPIHKHSNKAYVLGAGTGAWTWNTVEEAAKAMPNNFNLVDPPLRDGFATPPVLADPVWLAVRYQVVNPGPFLLHCHIQSHLNGGMAMVIMDGVDAWPTVPAEYLN